MKEKVIYNQLNEVIKKHKAEYRLIRANHVPELEAEFAYNYAKGLFDEEFFNERLTSFHFSIDENESCAIQSVLLIALPQPVVMVYFHWNDSEYAVTVPPTYDQQTDRKIMMEIEKILNPYGYHITRARIPEKAMAVRSGLMQYGRNNIGYINNSGSFFRPVAFFTDLSCKDDVWGPPLMLDRCNRCKACLKACPTKAIDENRFLLHAERCITFHNEHLKEIPDYVTSSMHHCLIGCMICQSMCPANRQNITRIEERERFTESETSQILENTPIEILDTATRAKLDRLSLSEDYAVICRNLKLLLQQE
jgi:epoxyqueuosine reductase